MKNLAHFAKRLLFARVMFWWFPPNPWLYLGVIAGTYDVETHIGLCISKIVNIGLVMPAEEEDS